jgi:hypothetical protein
MKAASNKIETTYTQKVTYGSFKDPGSSDIEEVDVVELPNYKNPTGVVSKKSKSSK